MTRWLLLLTLSLTPAAAHAADPFFFQPKDRVVFLGDSITEQYQYSTDIELYLTTRFPQGGMLFLNAGIGGDTATGGASRFVQHVLADKPTKITINFGMNDAAYGNFDAARNKQYVEKTEAMLAAAQKAGVPVALVSPNAVDRRGRPNFKVYLETQKRFYAPLAGLAAKHEYPFADQYAVTRAALEAMEKDDLKAEKAKPFTDGVHTSPAGGLLMAHAILTQLHAPADVSAVEVDAKTGTAKGTHARVTDVKATPAGVSFTRLDDALPMPVQGDWVSILPYVNNLKDLNRYALSVSGLAEGNYGVLIDGTEVATASAAELAKGVDLGEVTSGPVWEQGNKVFAAINAKNKLVRDRFGKVTRATIPEWIPNGEQLKEAERAKRMTAIEAAQTAVYDLAQPKPRKFEVVKK
jgi:lysophospholipase L1-like esterase